MPSRGGASTAWTSTTTIARLRIHGTTRQQVWTHFLATDRPALQPLAAEPFPLFASGLRLVHANGHVEVQGALYPAPAHLVHQPIRVRWDRALVRLYEGDTLRAVHARVGPGQYAPRSGASPGETTSTQRVFQEQLLGRCARVGLPLRQWTETAVAERGVRLPGNPGRAPLDPHPFAGPGAPRGGARDHLPALPLQGSPAAR
jgi:hypothetical protein